MSFIPEFAASQLAAAGDVLKERQTSWPLFNYFVPSLRDGESEIRLKKYRTYNANFSGFDEPSPRAPSHPVEIVRATPMLLKQARALTNSEGVFFRRYNVLQKQQMATASDRSKRLSMINDMTRELVLPIEEESHRFMASALQGNMTYKLANGPQETVNLGLNDLTGDITGGWENPAAPIIQDIYKMIDEFTEHADATPDTIFFNYRAWTKFFAQNTDFLTYVKATPELAQSFIGHADRSSIGTPAAPMDRLMKMFQPTAPFKMLGLNWQPIEGSYLDINNGNAKTQRWDLNKVSLARVSTGAELPTLVDVKVANSYNDAGNAAFYGFEGVDPKVSHVGYAKTTLPLIQRHEYVQTATIAS